MSRSLAFFLAGALGVVFCGASLFMLSVLAYYLLPFFAIAFIAGCIFTIRNVKKQRDERKRQKSYIDALRYDKIQI